MNKIPEHITEKFLRDNPNMVFVFGDNLLHVGKGGAAILRDEPNAYGFITKKYPNNNDASFYRPEEYEEVFEEELSILMISIINNPNKIYLITKLGAGLANRYHIYEKVIKPGLEVLDAFENVRIL
jgi:hypothetical protein